MRRSLYDYIETIVHIVPEVVTMWRATDPEGFVEVTEKLLVHAVTHLEQQAKDLRGFRENGITAAAIIFFNRYGIRASRETNSRGHVDIFVQHNWKTSFVICGEAKIWHSVRSHIDGLAQVLGYTTGRMPYCFVLSYVTKGAIQAHVDALRDALNSERPEKQSGPCSNHHAHCWMLCSEHLHSSGRPVRALHAAVNLV